MAKRKNPNIRMIPRQTQAAARVRLSQCMIVKNEEKNIERALAWAKPFAYEQIVVDTGSTDDTVNIAKRLGASVYHFPWINDFAAAKNFAISKARGNWIAFLDADEYFAQNDAKRVFSLLKTLEQKRAKGILTGDVILTSLANLNDEGKIFYVISQMRIFRNIPSLHYEGAIHEKLASKDGAVLKAVLARELTIMHTGYASSVYKETNKLERNMRALEAEVEKSPEDMTLKAYLSESYFGIGDINKALPLFNEVIYSGDKTLQESRLRQVYTLYLRTLESQRDMEELEQIARHALERFSRATDYHYFLGDALFYQKQFDEARASYEAALEMIEGDTHDSYVSTNAQWIYNKLLIIASHYNDSQSIVRYSVLSLRWYPNQASVLTLLIKALKASDAELTSAQMLDFLSKLYDLTTLKYKLLLLKCALSIEDSDLSEQIKGLFTEEESEWLNAKDSETLEPGIDELIERLEKTDETALHEEMLTAFNNMRPENKAAMTRGIKLLLNSDADDESIIRDEFTCRAHYLADNTQALKRLYETLGDIRSKNVLYAILLNWTNMNMVNLLRVKDKLYTTYLDQDLISCDADEVFVDVGAFSGDTIYDYILAYNTYKRIYAYEPTPETYEQLKKYTGQKGGIVISRAAVGEACGEAYLLPNALDSALNSVARDQTQTPVRLVSLDEDIGERITFIKVDAAGMEMEVVEGARRHINKDRPKLAIKISAKTKDIAALVQRVNELNPNYNYYLRYYGGNLIPSEIVLYALEAQSLDEI